MSERKRVVIKPVTIAVTPRQRDAKPEVPEIKKPESNKKNDGLKVEPERKRVSGEIPISEAPKIESKPRPKTSIDKYIRFSFEELRDDNVINSINRQTINGEIKYAYYATDNDIGYHYYIVIKK